MSPIHDWQCAEHGVFEGAQDICPAFGCDSSTVVKIFRKPPGYKSARTGAIDAHLEDAMKKYGLTDIGGRGQPRPGAAMRWGDDIGNLAVNGHKVLPEAFRTAPALMAAASTPVVNAQTAAQLGIAPDDPNGMRATHRELGNKPLDTLQTRAVKRQDEFTVVKGDAEDRAKILSQG